MSESISYPWLAFNWRFLEKISISDWVLLGEAESKCNHIASEPLLPRTRSELHMIYLAKGVLATTAIEGNTLTEEQVRQQIEGTLNLPKSKQYLGREVENILTACNELMRQIERGAPPPLSIDLIKHFNSQVLANLDVDELTVPGQIRMHTVRVGPYLPPPAEECPDLLQRLVNWLNEPLEFPDHLLAAGILKAIVAHLYIAWIHPFGDGNGRTARLVELYLLFAFGAPSTAVQLLSNHYNQTRAEYYRQLDRASKTGEVGPFVEYALQGFVDGLYSQLEYIQQQQIDVHWENFVYSVFRDDDSIVGKRRRNLVLDISEQDGPVALGSVRFVSPRTAEAYASKQDRTIYRDVEELVRLKLLGRSGNQVYARKDRMLERRPAALRNSASE